MFKHILVPTDGSALSRKAIDGAIDLAQSVGARITAYACLPLTHGIINRADVNQAISNPSGSGSQHSSAGG